MTVQVIAEIFGGRRLPERINEIRCRRVLNPGRAIPILNCPAKRKTALASGFQSVVPSSSASKTAEGFFIGVEILVPTAQEYGEVGVPDPLNRE